MSKKLDGAPLDEATIAKSKPAVPIGWDGTPEDFAATVAYLVRDDAGFTTGRSFIVDGGSWKL